MVRAIVASMRGAPLRWFFALAFAWTWTDWIAMALAGQRVDAGPVPSHFPGLFGPMVAAFIVTAVSSAAYLSKRTRSLTWDRLAGASAEVGVLFMGITLLTGSLWGRVSWGVYWVWDSRVTTTAFLFVTYLGYLAVRGLGGSHDQRARRSAVVALLSVLEIPLVHFSVEWWRPLHQQESIAKGKLENLMLFSLFIGVIVFTLLYVWLVLHRQRVMAMQDALDDHGLEFAIAERREEANI